MSKLISELLGITDPLFGIKIQNLERASNHQSIDVRLSAEIIAKTHQKMRELGLDPKDTTNEELYNSLLLLVRRHDDFLAQKLGVRDKTDVQEVLSRARIFMQHLDTPKAIWALKPIAAKRLLKAQPPRKVMKHLGYRSVDSMLKREPIAHLFAAMRILETDAWQENLHKKYRKLTPTDFENRNIKFINLDAANWSQPTGQLVADARHNILALPEAGAVAILPLPVQHMQGLSITVLPLLVHAVAELRVLSTYLKAHHMKDDFGQLFSDTLRSNQEPYATIAGHEISWSHIHRHFGAQKAHPEFFEPHVQREDIVWQKTEEVLYRIEPALHFWYQTDYVGQSTKAGQISLNLMDVAVNNLNNLTYGYQVSGYMRESLSNELTARYLREPALEGQLVKQLDIGASDLAEPEFVLQESF